MQPAAKPAPQAALFIGVFFAAAATELWANLTGNGAINFFSKPLLVLSLLLYSYLRTQWQPSKRRNVFLLALFLGWVGDCLLLFVYRSPHFFTGGLVAFLFGHLAYCYVFAQDATTPFVQTVLRRQWWLAALVAIVGVILYGAMYPVLGVLQLPVLAYTVVLAAMVLTAAGRKSGVSAQSYTWVLAGAMLFMVSDGTLAVNKFLAPLPNAGFAIMLTYMAAQYCIVRGYLMALPAGEASQYRT